MVRVVIVPDVKGFPEKETKQPKTAVSKGTQFKSLRLMSRGRPTPWLSNGSGQKWCWARGKRREKSEGNFSIEVSEVTRERVNSPWGRGTT